MGATNEQVRAARALVKEAAATSQVAHLAIVEADMEREMIERTILESDRRTEPYREALLRACALVAPRRVF